MAKIKKSQIILLMLMLGIITGPVFDLISTYLSYSGAEFSRATLVTRGFFIVLVIATALAVATKRHIASLLILFTPLFPMAIWYFLDLYSGKALFESIAFLTKILSLFALITLFSLLRDKQLNQINILIKASLAIYMLCIIAGAAFNIEMFESYKTIERSGYKGIITAQNEATGLVFISLLISGFRISTNQATNLDKALFAITAIASFLLGTKPGLILPIVVIAIIYIAENGYIKSIPKIILATALFGALGFVIFSYIPAAKNALNMSLSYFLFQLDHYANGNLVTLLLSGRDNKLDYAVEHYILQNPSYLLFGGYPVGGYVVEIDFIDLAMLFGLPIFAIYLRMVYLAFKGAETTQTARYYMLSFAGIILLANTAGHIFTSALVIPYIAYFCTLKAHNKESKAHLNV